MKRRSYLTLAQISNMRPSMLSTEWARRYGAPPPNISPDLLRLGLAYKSQEQRQGALSRSTRTLLARATAGRDAPVASPVRARKLTPGTRLVRDWHGVGHTVTVLEKGFEYSDDTWPSLSAIAKAITGAHWNGPRFFGLTEARK
ncbi:MAG: DUF2924 domain-containing protein [Sandaracinobacter sp.]